jgi:hypothetical protein
MFTGAVCCVAVLLGVTVELTARLKTEKRLVRCGQRVLHQNDFLQNC